MLVEFIRGEDKKPFGVVVAIADSKIGYSLCNPKDKWNKERGLLIAEARAKKASENPCFIMPKIPEKKINKVYSICSKMVNRSKLYFKEN